VPCTAQQAAAWATCRARLPPLMMIRAAIVVVVAAVAIVVVINTVRKNMSR